MIFLVIGLLLYVTFVQLNFFEWLSNVLKNNEGSQLDELLLSVLITGVLGFVYGARRFADLAREMERGDNAEKHVRWIATHDSLTRLLNRQGLTETVENLRGTDEAGKPWVAYSIDIDGFNRLNEVHGSEAGDAVLVEVAERLRAVFSSEHVYRIDGNEFFAAEPRLPGFDYAKTANRAAKLIAQPIVVAGTSIEVTASIGLARYPEDAAFIDHLVRCAKTAMRAAKKASVDVPRWFDPSLDVAIVRRAQLEKELRLAIRDGLLRPYYQPQIDLTTGDVISFEALARWRRDDGSFVSPVDFIPLAEETGLINDIFALMFRQACIDARTWPNRIGLAFNVSPAQLRDSQLGEKIRQTLDETGLSPRRLEVEITETALVEDLTQAEAVLADLRRAGVSIALDDFGTGYSSLSQLARLRFDKLKIDRSFVASFEDDDRQAKIVRAMIGLGRGLGMTTIAEGIEEASQAETLLHLGCHHGQGFYYGRAVPVEETMPFVRSNSRRAS